MKRNFGVHNRERQNIVWREWQILLVMWLVLIGIPTMIFLLTALGEE